MEVVYYGSSALTFIATTIGYVVILLIAINFFESLFKEFRRWKNRQ